MLGVLFLGYRDPKALQSNEDDECGVRLAAHYRNRSHYVCKMCCKHYIS